MKVLYINTNPKEESQSKTMQLGRTFVDCYKKHNPKDEIVEFNLYETDIDFLNKNDLNDIANEMSNGQEDTNGNNNEQSKMRKLSQYFASFDKYIIVTPMWNLNVPSIFHAFIDYIVYAGITFKYTANGPIGLLKGKKAIYISTTGGIYDTDETKKFNFGREYVHGIMNFMGIEMAEDIILSGTDVFQGDVLKSKVADAQKDAISKAEKF